MFRALSFGVPFVLVLVITFSSSAFVGAGIETHDNYTNATAELSSLSDDLKQDIRENHSGLSEDVTLWVAGGIAETAEWSALSGLALGYQNPAVGKAVGYTTPIAALVGTALVVYRRFRRVV